MRVGPVVRRVRRMHDDHDRTVAPMCRTYVRGIPGCSTERLGVIDWCGAVVHETGDRGRRKNRHAVDALASSAEEGRG